MLNATAARVARRDRYGRCVLRSGRIGPESTIYRHVGLGKITIRHDPGIMVYARRYFTG